MYLPAIRTLGVRWSLSTQQAHCTPVCGRNVCKFAEGALQVKHALPLDTHLNGDPVWSER